MMKRLSGTTIPTTGRRKTSRFGVYVDAQGKLDRTYRGTVYRSLQEMRHAQELDLRKRAGEITAWFYEPMSYTLMVNGESVGVYTPDFVVTLADGRQEIEEIKGRANESYPLRVKVWRACWLKDHPAVDHLVIYADGTERWRGTKKVESTRPRKRSKSLKKRGVVPLEGGKTG